MTQQVPLIGKVVVKGSIHVITGLRIGGPTTGVKIGGIDQPVISDPWGRPYIPGSSLKGKLRSLMEKKEHVTLDTRGNHVCQSVDDYNKCVICKIWGIMGDKIKEAPTLTRIIFRDTYLDEKSITQEMRRNLELQWTEIKMETAINRLTGTALSGSLRQIERIPAGAKFRPFEIIYSCYEETDKKILSKVFEAMELLEHDYLGGMGSRGYGKVKFEEIEIYWNTRNDYEKGAIDKNRINDSYNTPSLIVQNFEQICNKLN